MGVGNRDSAITRTERIAADLRRRITEGEFAVGDKLPTLTALCVEYQPVSEGTVHEAVRALQREGVVESRRKLGTIVVAVPGTTGPDAELEEMRHALAELADRVSLLESRVNADE